MAYHYEVEHITPTVLAVHEGKLSSNWRSKVTHNVNMFRRLLHWLFVNYDFIDFPNPKDPKAAYSFGISISMERSLYDFVFQNKKFDLENCRKRIAAIAPHWKIILCHVEAMRSKFTRDQDPKAYLETVYSPHFTFMRTSYMRLIERWFDICHSPEDTFKLSFATKNRLNDYLNKINLETKQMPKVPLQLIKICNFSKKLVNTLTCSWPVFLKKFFFLDFCYIFRKGEMPTIVYQPQIMMSECNYPNTEVREKICLNEWNEFYNLKPLRKTSNHNIYNSSSRRKSVNYTNLRRSKRYQFNPFESDDKSLLKHLLPPEQSLADDQSTSENEALTLGENAIRSPTASTHSVSNALANTEQVTDDPSTSKSEVSTSGDNTIQSQTAIALSNALANTEQVTWDNQKSELISSQQQPAVSSTLVNSTTNSSPDCTNHAKSSNENPDLCKKRKVDNNSCDDDSSHLNNNTSIMEEENISYTGNLTIDETPRACKRKIPCSKLDSSLKRNIFSCNSVSTSVTADEQDAADSKSDDNVSVIEIRQKKAENQCSIEDDDIIFIDHMHNNSSTIEGESLKSFLSSQWFDQVWSPGMDKYLMRYICANPVCLEEFTLHNRLLAEYPKIFNGTNVETLRYRVGFLANSERLKKLCGYNNIKSQSEKKIFESKLIKLRQWMNEFGENFTLSYN